MKKRFLSILLCAAMLLGMLPAGMPVAQATETQTPTVSYEPQVVELLPPEYAGISTFGFTPGMADREYAYEGMEDTYVSPNDYITILDPVTGEALAQTTEPAQNGVVQMVDGEGNVVASSNAVSYSSETEYDYETSTSVFLRYRIYSARFENFSKVPAGIYTLQYNAGNDDIYPCTGEVQVVSKNDLLLQEAYCNIIAGQSEASVQLYLYGFDTEEELNGIELSLHDSEGNEVATSTGNFKDFNIYYDGTARCWYLYAQLLMKDDDTFIYDEVYSLRFSYTGSKMLVCGLTTYEDEAGTSNERLSLTDLLAADPQTGLIQLVLSNYENYVGTKLTVIVKESGYSSDAQPRVLGQWEGFVPETGTVEMQLTTDGVQLPLTAYGQWFYVQWGLNSATSYNSNNFDNPYYDLGGEGTSWDFSPYYISSSTTSFEYELTWYNGDADLIKDSGNVLTVRTTSGQIMGTSTDLRVTEVWDSGGIAVGTMTLSSALTVDTSYQLWLNDVQLAGASVYVRDELIITNYSGLLEWDSGSQAYKCYTNLGIFGLRFEGLNSAQSGTFLIRDAEDDLGAIKVQQTVTGVLQPNGMRLYTVSIPAADIMAKLEDGHMYTIHFKNGATSDPNAEEKKLRDMIWDAQVNDLTFVDPNYDQFSIDSTVAGSTTLSMRLYTRYSDGIRNVEVSALDRVTQMTFVHRTTGEVIRVTAHDGGSFDENYYYQLNLTLDKPLQSGYYYIYMNGTAVGSRSFSVADPNEPPEIYSHSDLKLSDGYVTGDNLPDDGVYTAKLYFGYTCLTETPIRLTMSEWHEDRLEFDPADMPADLPAGTYELRVYMGESLIGATDLKVVPAVSDEPIVQVYQGSSSYGWYRIFYSSYTDVYEGVRKWVIDYRVSLANGGAYTMIRTATSQEELADTEYEAYVENSYEYFWVTELGEQTIYVQLATADQKTESKVYEFKVYCMEEGDTMPIYVPESTQGIYSGTAATFSVGLEAAPYATVIMELADANGNSIKLPMVYEGLGEVKGLAEYTTPVYGLESDHPYVLEETYTKTYTVAGAESIDVTFSPLTELAYGASLEIYYGEDTSGYADLTFSYYYSDDLAGQTFTIPGDTVTVVMTSYDYYGSTAYGFAITDVRATGTTDPVDPENQMHVYSYTIDNVNASLSYNITPANCETIRFWLEDDNGEIISEVVERSLIFGSPDAVILPQFRNGYYEHYVKEDSFTVYGYATPYSTVTLTDRSDDSILGEAVCGPFGRFEIELTELEDGTCIFEVAQTDGAITAASAFFTVDTTPPTVGKISFAFGEGGVATIRWECDDTDVYSFTIYKNGVKVGTVYPYSSSYEGNVYTVTASRDDGNLFTIRAEDEAGHTGERTVSTADSEPPQAPGSVTVTAATTGSVTLSWTAGSDLNEDGTAGSGVMGYDVYVDGKEVVRLTGESTLSYTVTGLQQGESYTFGVYTRDKAGNISLTPTTVTGKTATLSVGASSLEDSYVMDEISDKKIYISAPATSDIAGHTPTVQAAKFEFRKQGQSQWTEQTFWGGSGTAGGNWDISGNDHGYLTPGTYEVRITITDNEGATATGATEIVQLMADEEVPVVTFLSPNGQIVRGEELSFNASATDNVTVKWIELSYAPAGSESFTVIEKLEASYGAVNDVLWQGADELADGTYTIRVTAFDQRGNKGVKDYTLTLDNTPPAVPADLTIRGTSRVVVLQWSKEAYVASADFYRFNVYRAESTNGTFEHCDSIYVGDLYRYLDDEQDITADKDYYYYVTAEDKVGNETEPVVVSARIVTDKQSPVITADSLQPTQGRQVRRTAELQVSASDNYKLAKAVFSYKLEGEDVWTQIAAVDVTGDVKQNTYTYEWLIPQEVYGKAQLRVQVYDDSIRDQEAYGCTANAAAEQIVDIAIMPYFPPEEPVLSATAEYKLANLSWTYPGEVDTLRHFVVYRVNNDGSYDYVTTVAAGESGKCAVDIPKTGEQTFVVRAVDKLGETADSNTVSVTSAAGDTEKPVAKITPEQLTAAVGHAYTFSGEASTDNGGIISWKWSFGDGTTGEGATCSHTYEAAGSYTVSLTVEDEYDNTSTITATIDVYDVSSASGYSLVTFEVVNAAVSTTPAVVGAQITVTASDGFTGGGVTDAKGEVTLVAPVGALTVTVMAEGYMAISRQVAVKPTDDGLFHYRVGATPTNVSLVDGKLTQKRMTYDEIVAAGIDTSDPDNNHVWKFAATLKFETGLRLPFEIPVEGYFNGNGYIEGTGTGWGWHSYGGGNGGGGGGGYTGTTGYAGINIGIFPISEHFLLVIYGEAHWLKEMYNVELLVINNSYVDDITDCVATLSLPDGLSLAAMVGEQQSASIEIGAISHKTGEDDEANTAKCNWYVRGDKEGEYDLTATVTGNNPDPFIKKFVTDEPVKVYAGSALHLTIKAQDVAFFGEDYKVTFTLKNVSDIDLYNLSFGLTGVEQYKVVGVSDNVANLLLGHEDFGDDMTVSLDVMHPGDYITIELTTNCLFYSTLQAAMDIGLVDLGPMEVAYYLTGIFVTTLEGSTTTIPHSVEIEHVPHSSFYEWLEEQLEDGVINLVDKVLFDKIPVVDTAVKVYKYNAELEEGVNARGVITVNGGEVVRYGSRSASTGAIKVYTDAAPGDYEISADGKTLILKADANVYVEGVQDGEATVTVTTHVKNLQTGEYEPNEYELLYQVGEAASWPHVRDAEVQEQNGSWTFTGELLDYDETVNVVFALYDDAGRMVGVTSQTIAANATDRALQCVAKANGVASVKMFLLGSTGVPLAMEKILK